MKSILIGAGGTGAQGSVIVKYLATHGYSVKVLTRNVDHPHAKALAALDNVTLLPSSPTGHDEESFLAAAKDVDYCFINTDGFAIGEIVELHWGIRFFELARLAGIKHYIYSSLDYVNDLDLKFHTGHYSGKSRVAQFMKAQSQSPMAWSILTTGPYMEQLHESKSPSPSEDGTYLIRMPLGDGAVPQICLDDIPKYVDWLLSHPEESKGMELKVATAHETGDEVAAAFTTVTGKPAKYVDIPISAYLNALAGSMPDGTETKVGFKSGNVPLNQSFGTNFSAWWQLYRNSKGNRGVITRNYDLLDRILPDRIRSTEEWMRKIEYTGEKKIVLKDRHDNVFG